MIVIKMHVTMQYKNYLKLNVCHLQEVRYMIDQANSVA